MRNHTFLRLGIPLLAIVFWLAALAGEAKSPKLPQAILNAHALFLVNETGFADLGYTVVLELQKWGQFELADSPEKADLLLRLDSGSHVRLLPDGQSPSAPVNPDAEEAVPEGYTRVSLLDPKTDQVLWSDMHKTEGGKVKGGHLLDGLREAFRDYEKGKR